MNFNRIETEIGIIHFCRGPKTTELSKRAFQTQIIQGLIREAGYSSHEIKYKSSGQPYFEGENMPFLSISHSENYGAIYIAKCPIGIDIQTYHPRISDGKNYFINANEIQFLSYQELHIVWAVKEAIFKSLEGEITNARQELTVTKIDVDSMTVHAHAGLERKQLGYLCTTEFVIAYSID